MAASVLKEFAKTELKLLKEQEKYRIRYAENVREQYHEIRRIRHDTGAHFGSFKEFIRKLVDAFLDFVILIFPA